jgi:hypothetical protein
LQFGRRLGAVLLIVALFGACSSDPGHPDVVNHALPRPKLSRNLKIHHVFVINLENKGFFQTFGDASAAPYLAHTLRARGQLLTNYFAIAHPSLPNYIAEISGQAPDAATQADCQIYSNFELTGFADYGQARGDGCVYPNQVKTIADQLDVKRYTWRSYNEDMEASATEPKTCRHAKIGHRDDKFPHGATDLYTTRTNPFVYFHSIIDGKQCRNRVVPLTFLGSDIAEESTTPNVAFVTPNLCHSGHNKHCGVGIPGGLPAMDGWLQQWIPKILDSEGFRSGGLLIIVFDEANAADARACCHELPGPNVSKPGLTGPGGGRMGALIIGRDVRPGSVNATPYNHYSLLCSVENVFGLAHLGMAAVPRTPCFGRDVFAAAPV